jgi:hypothetical protein
MELLGCQDGTIGNLAGSPTCSGIWQSVIVPDSFPVQEVDILASGEFFMYGFTIAGVLLITGLIAKSVLNFIKY